MWSWPLNLSMEAQDYFDQKLLTCNTTSTATTGTNTGYTIPAEENVPADFPMYYLLMYRDPNCLIRPLWFKLLQCALQVIFSVQIAFNKPLYSCDKQGYCNRVLDFSPVNNLVHRMVNLIGIVRITSDILNSLKVQIKLPSFKI